MFPSQSLSRTCSQTGTGVGTLEGVVKERKGSEQLEWPGIFLSTCSLRASPCGLLRWASLGFLTASRGVGQHTWQLKASRVSIPAGKAESPFPFSY